MLGCICIWWGKEGSCLAGAAFDGVRRKNAWNQLWEELEKDCDVNIYKAALRTEEKGLSKSMFKNFLIEIEPNEQLNRIFKARTYRILHSIRDKVY